jgi:class 3 adenylate cyclase
MEIVRTHDRIVRGALATNQRSDGKQTVDGIKAAFESVVRAIESALLIHRALDESAREDEQPIQDLIAISAGEPVTEHNDLFGAAVQLAARACARADPSSIDVSDEVRSRYEGNEIDFEIRGPFELKGFEEPVHLYEVSWRSDA